MLNLILPATFQNSDESANIRIDILVRMVNAVSYTSLGSEMDDHIEVMLGK